MVQREMDSSSNVSLRDLWEDQEDKLLPLQLSDLVLEFRSPDREISEESVLEFLKKSVKFFDGLTDDNFGPDTYSSILDPAEARYDFVSTLLREECPGGDTGAVYYLFFLCLIIEIFRRGPDHVKQMFAQSSQHGLKELCSSFQSLHVAVLKTEKRSSIASFVMELCSASVKDQMVLFCKLAESHPSRWGEKLHSLRDSIMPDHELGISVFIVDMNNGTKYERAVYRDVKLGWLMKYHCAKFPAPYECTEVTHGCRKISIKSSRNKSLRELGIEPNDNIFVEEDFEEFDTSSFHLPPEMIGYLKESDNINQVNFCEGTLDLWCKLSLNDLPSDKDFNIEYYQRMEREVESLHILAAEFLLRGEDPKAMHLLCYLALWRESLESSPDYMKEFFSSPEGRSDRVIGSSFRHLRDAMTAIECRRSMIELLSKPNHAISCRANMILNAYIDSLWRREEVLKTEPYFSITKDMPAFDYRRYITLKLFNSDSGRAHKIKICDQVYLRWLLKLHVLCNCDQDPNSSITPSTTYHWVLFQGKTIFLSGSTHKTLKMLGFEDGHSITVGGAQHEKKDSRKITQKAKPKSNKKKWRGAGKKKKRAQAPAPVLSESQLEEENRKEHSRAMMPVFEEMHPLLKSIRTRLNHLAVQKTAPKVKVSNPKRRMKHPQDGLQTVSMDGTVYGKGGKKVYPILVGNLDNLYKMTKWRSSAITVIDLHGLTKDEAIKKLDESLPSWMEAAMNGDHPWVLPVDIVCGGGSQTLSETVRHWIRAKRQVANRPKGYA